MSQNRENPDFSDLLFSINSKSIVSTLDFSPDGRILAFGTVDGKLNIFDISTGKLFSINISKESILQLKFSPNGKYLALTTGKNIVIWNFSPWTIFANFTDLNFADKLAFSHDSNSLISTDTIISYCGPSCTQTDYFIVSLYSLINKTKSRAINPNIQSNGIKDISFSENDKEIIILSGLGSLMFYDLSSHKFSNTQNPIYYYLSKFNPYNSPYLLIDYQEDIKIFDIYKNNLFLNIKMFNLSYSKGLLTKNAEKVILLGYSSSNKFITLIDTESKTVLQNKSNLQDLISSDDFLLSPEGSLLVLADITGHVKIFNLVPKIKPYSISIPFSNYYPVKESLYPSNNLILFENATTYRINPPFPLIIQNIFNQDEVKILNLSLPYCDKNNQINGCNIEYRYYLSPDSNKIVITEFNESTVINSTSINFKSITIYLFDNKTNNINKLESFNSLIYDNLNDFRLYFDDFEIKFSEDSSYFAFFFT